MASKELSISGMSCGHCVAAVREALTQVPGVVVERVEVGRAVLHVEPGTVTDGALVDAVQDAGYSATVAP